MAAIHRIPEFKKLSDNEKHILTTNINYILRDDFLKTLRYISQITGVSSEYIGFYYDGETDEECIKNGVIFFLEEVEIKISFDFFYNIISICADEFLKTNASSETIVKEYLERINKKLCNN